jgi:hypothetical protein
MGFGRGRCLKVPACIATQLIPIQAYPPPPHPFLYDRDRPRASTMLLPITLLSFTWFVSVNAGSQAHGQNCSVANNRLQVGTYQFWSNCDTVTFCNSSSLCDLKKCRRDDFPFGYPQDDDNLPTKCPKGQFCPDEEDACQPLLAVGSPCQLNRDGGRSCCAHKYLSTHCLQTNARRRITLHN